MSERSGPQARRVPTAPTVALNEEPFEDPTADDQKDWSDDEDLREDELTDDTANEEISSIVPAHDRVEEIPEAGWANQPPPPNDFPEVFDRKRKEGV